MVRNEPKVGKVRRKRSDHPSSERMEITKKRRFESTNGEEAWSAITQIRPKKKATEEEQATETDRKTLKDSKIEEGWDEYMDGNKWTSLPPRWADESDLDPEDLDARILRCKRRIAQGIVPKAFESKLKRLNGIRDAQQKLIAAYPGLSYPVIQRMKALKTIEGAIKRDGDPCKELPNVRALMAAYREGKLTFDGQVTYWSGGKKVYEAEKFELKDFWRLNKGNRGEKGFWVEGISGLGPSPALAKMTRYPTTDGTTVIDCALRLGQDLNVKAPPAVAANLRPEIEFEFLDDTGSTYMQLYQDDVKQLMGIAANTQDWPFEQIMGYETTILADGRESVDLLVLLEVNMFDKRTGDPSRQLMMNQWAPVMAVVEAGADQVHQGLTDRLAGSWLRQCLYTATAPQNPGRLYISTTKSALVGRTMLPALDSSLARPELTRPKIAANWYRVGAKGIKQPTRGLDPAPGAPKEGRLPGDGVGLNPAPKVGAFKQAAPKVAGPGTGGVGP